MVKKQSPLSSKSISNCQQYLYKAYFFYHQLLSAHLPNNQCCLPALWGHSTHCKITLLGTKCPITALNVNARIIPINTEWSTFWLQTWPPWNIVKWCLTMLTQHLVSTLAPTLWCTRVVSEFSWIKFDQPSQHLMVLICIQMTGGLWTSQNITPYSSSTIQVPLYTCTLLSCGTVCIVQQARPTATIVNCRPCVIWRPYQLRYQIGRPNTRPNALHNHSW